jgi:hypothetical protein
MSQPNQERKPESTQESQQESRQVVVVGPDGKPMAAVNLNQDGTLDTSDENGEPGPADMIEQPAKIMRIGSMVKQLLEEVRSAPLDDAARARMRDVHQSSIKELCSGLAPELCEELDRVMQPLAGEEVPSDAELRVAQAQLVGWLEGLFQGIQTAMLAQQMAARVQLEQLRGRPALPGGQAAPGMGHAHSGAGGTGQYL